jgi:hypothetical protein
MVDMTVLSPFSRAHDRRHGEPSGAERLGRPVPSFVSLEEHSGLDSRFAAEREEIVSRDVDLF